ncbi:MAG: NADH-quinone oxidoreductase subunit N [Elusimicrobia bacterium]|nr:NADH-quinone oxidoreductase subunit N [Elusimicrobiota bacterium]
MENLRLLIPEIVLSAMALLLMLAELFIPRRHSRILLHLALLASAAALGTLGLAASNPAVYQGAGSLWVVDPMSLFFKVIVLAATILVLMLAVDARRDDDAHLGSFAGLILLASAGMMLLVSAVDLLMVFLSLELISISSFILVGFERGDIKSAEGALKYYLIGAFSSALMVFGISLFYGATGTTHLLKPVPQFGYASSALFLLSTLMMLAGFGFKISMAPFHLWVPDAYEAAPTPITTFLSIAPKAAGLAMMLRVFTKLIPHPALEMTALFSFLAMLTMTVGNLTAIRQNNIKRLLAYSSIAQAGYMLIGFVTADAFGREGVLLYALAYLFMNAGAFAVAIAIGNEEGYELEAYDGLAQRSLGLAVVMAFFLLSLAGIPPLAGFVGKFYLFGAAVQSGFYGLAVVAVLNSVVSVYYYMRVTYHMFFLPPRATAPAQMGLYLYSGLALAAVAVILIGVYPEPFLSVVKSSAEMIP